MSFKQQGKSFTITAAVCVLACLLYLAFLASASWQQSIDAIRSISGALWSMILALSGINYLLRFWRWSFAIKTLAKFQIPELDHFFCYIAGFAFTATPGKVGEAIRTLFLEKRGISRSASLAAFVFEKVLDLLAIMLLALLILVEFPGFIPLTVGGGVLFLFVFLIMRRSFFGWLDKRFRETIYQVGKDSLAAPFTYVSSIRGLAIGLASWALEGIGLYLVLRAMGADVTVVLALGVYGAAVLAGAVSFIPGGIGGTEAVMIGILVSCGVPLSAAVAATLVCRIATLWFAVGLGLLALPAVLIGQKNKNGR